MNSHTGISLVHTIQLMGTCYGVKVVMVKAFAYTDSIWCSVWGDVNFYAESLYFCLFYVLQLWHMLLIHAWFGGVV